MNNRFSIILSFLKTLLKICVSVDTGAFPMAHEGISCNGAALRICIIGLLSAIKIILWEHKNQRRVQFKLHLGLGFFRINERLAIALLGTECLETHLRDVEVRLESS